MPKPIRCVRFTKVLLRKANDRDPNPSLNRICPGDPRQRSPNAQKFKDRTQEETRWQEHWARVEAGKENPDVRRGTENYILLTYVKKVSPFTIQM